MMLTVPVSVDFEQLKTSLPTLTDRPLLVAVSGFGGAGKSTLAERLSDELHNAQVVSSDDFTINQQRKRCDDWSSIDRQRLAADVLQPARAGKSITYQAYDWPHNRLDKWRTIEPPAYLIVEGIGIVHPDILELFDVTVWIDAELETANERGRYRDKEIYKVDHDNKWLNLWTPNDHDYFERFKPDTLVDFLYVNL